ncbi:hypothetical protein MTO96_007895 [Rhipicephalus appendiculatus]
MCRGMAPARKTTRAAAGNAAATAANRRPQSRREQRRIESMMFRSPRSTTESVFQSSTFRWRRLVAGKQHAVAVANGRCHWGGRRAILAVRRPPPGSSSGRRAVCRVTPPPGYQYTEDTLQHASSGSLPTSDMPSPVARAYLQWRESVETMNPSVPGDSEPLSPESPTSPPPGLSQQELQQQESMSASGVANTQNTVSFAVAPAPPPEQDAGHQSIHMRNHHLHVIVLWRTGGAT